MTLVPAVVVDLSTPVPKVRIAPPGKNALDDPDSDMLLAVGNAPAQIIVAGRVYLPAGVNVSILWPLALIDRPVLEIQTSDTADKNLIPWAKRGDAVTSIEFTVTTSGATFKSTNRARYLSYVAVARTI